MTQIVSNMHDIQAKEIDSLPRKEIQKFSICTMVTDHDQYSKMLRSFQDFDFNDNNCEFLYIDNSTSNKYDAYSGIRKFLSIAKGQYVILCHQDIRLIDNNYDDLIEKISEIETADPNWAVLGNAGGKCPGKFIVRITDHSYGKNAKHGPFPTRVRSVDENFIVLRGDANLGISRDLYGFHLYGTDLCIMADILGYNIYVIDFHLQHIGGKVVKNLGTKADDTSPLSFNYIRKSLIKKYKRAFSSRWIQTTCTIMYISGYRFLNGLNNRKIIYSILKRIYKLKYNK